MGRSLTAKTVGSAPSHLTHTLICVDLAQLDSKEAVVGAVLLEAEGDIRVLGVEEQTELLNLFSFCLELVHPCKLFEHLAFLLPVGV